MKKQNKLKFVLSITGIIALIVAAFFLPQIIFKVQDIYQLQGTKTEERSSLYSAQRSQAYETDTNARINNFLNLSNKTVTALDYEFADDAELSELLDDIFEQEWFYMLYDNMILFTFLSSEHFIDSFDVELLDCQKMLIHDKDYRNGVTLMMWYLDLYLTNVSTRIRLLVDTETDTIYYVKLTSDPLEDKSVMNLIEKYGFYDLKDVIEKYYSNGSYSNEYLYALAEDCHIYYDVYYQYYEADDATPFNEYEFSDEQYWYLIDIMDDNYCEVASQLPYGELCLKFQLIAKTSEGIYPNLEMGIWEIAEQIPEMLQD